MPKDESNKPEGSKRALTGSKMEYADLIIAAETALGLSRAVVILSNEVNFTRDQEPEGDAMISTFYALSHYVEEIVTELRRL